MIIYGVFMGLCAAALFLAILATFRDTPGRSESGRSLSTSSERG